MIKQKILKDIRHGNLNIIQVDTIFNQAKNNSWWII